MRHNLAIRLSEPGSSSTGRLHLPLSSELLSLAQHVELNKAGWWERTIQKLITASVWLHDGAATRECILCDLRDRCGVQTDQRVIQQIVALERAGTLIQLPSDTYKLTEASRRELETELTHAEQIKSTARDHFMALVAKNAPALDPVGAWKSFLTAFFEPTVKEFGAKLYQFISANEPVTPTHRIDAFINLYPEPLRPALRDTLQTFLHPHDEATRAFILASLNAYFYLEASNLTPSVIASIARSTKRNPTFDLFVDTNVL